MGSNYKLLYEDLIRQRKALDKKYIPLSIDKGAKTATFRGSSGEIYETSLDKCTCVDFAINQSPCKHMFRLAHEVGVYNIEKNMPQYTADQKNAIKTAEEILCELKKYWEVIPSEIVVSYCQKLIDLKTTTGVFK